MFEGRVEYQPYDTIIKRIKDFENYSVLGKDSSNTYDIYRIEMGKPDKPTIMFTASLHGTEWQGTSYSLSFFEKIRDGNFPNNEFRDFLLENFHIVYFPVVNVWGYMNTREYAITRGRLNSTGNNINRDFGEFKDIETRYIREAVYQYKPFSFLDMHLIRSNVNRDELLIIGNTSYETNDVRDVIAERWEEYSGFDVMLWGMDDLTNKGVTREWVAKQPNNHTPHTLAFITEITRPVKERDGFKNPLSDEQIYDLGQFSIYQFLKTSIDYYLKYNGHIVSQIEKPGGTASIVRDVNGITQSIEEEKENKSIETTSTRDKEGIVQRIIRKIKSL